MKITLSDEQAVQMLINSERLKMSECAIRALVHYLNKLEDEAECEEAEFDPIGFRVYYVEIDQKEYDELDPFQQFESKITRLENGNYLMHKDG